MRAGEEGQDVLWVSVESRAWEAWRGDRRKGAGKAGTLKDNIGKREVVTPFCSSS